MKKVYVYVFAALAAMSSVSSCCVGKWAAINACIEFNNGLTDIKIVNAIIAFILTPFEFTIGGFLDAVIFNTVEFWSGSNPLALNQTFMGKDGNLYNLASDKNGGYVITNLNTKQELALNFDSETRTWSTDVNGEEQKLFTMVDEQTMIVYSGNSQQTITLDEAGLMACHQLFESDENLAME